MDDSATMRRMIIASLTAIGGLAFEEAVSGLEAIERMTLAPVDLVMLDLNMPDVHGLEVLRFIRAQEGLRDLPVVVLTTRGDDDSRTAALREGATLYLTKPLREAIVTVEPLAARKGLELHYCNLPARLPMRTDAVKVRQIIINLLGNAVKFTERGRISIDVRAASDRSTVSFVIADTGPGIAADDLTRIFEPFVQASGSFRRTHEGTGLGLSVSRALARLLGGDLTVASVLGAGSVFTVTLPCDAPA